MNDVEPMYCIETMAASSDGKYLLIGSCDRNVWIVDASNFKPYKSYTFDKEKYWMGPVRASFPLRSVAFSADNQYALLYCHDTVGYYGEADRCSVMTATAVPA